jgi:hypothetical protein
MKKLLLAAAIMISSVAANAQNEVGQISIAPTVGINLSNLTKVDNSKMKFGIAAGAVAEYGVAEKFGVSFGLLYSQQGCKIKDEGEKWSMKLDYLNMPIMAQYYVVDGLAIKAGIQPGFLVTKKAKYDGTLTAVVAGESASKPYTESVTISDAKGFAFAIPVGLSYEYANFVLDARYNIGVTKAIKEYDCRHSVFSFTLGYKFAL